MDKDLENKLEEIEQRKRRLRTECNIANMATRDNWYSEKAKEIDLPQYEIISKEKVLEEIELIKKLEDSLK